MIEYWLARFVLASIAKVPRLAHFYVKLLDIAVPRFRRTARRNLQIAGISDESVMSGMWRSLARVLIAFAKFPSIDGDNVHEWIGYEGLENLKSAKARGCGVLIATAHLGNWELSAFAHALMSAPMHIVVRPLDNPRIDAMVEQRRALSGNHVIAKKEAAREIVRALKAGDSVGILVDQNVVADEGVFIDFFGMKACAGSAFAKLAHHSGAAVVPGYALWSEKEKKHVLRFDPEIPMAGDVLEDTQRVHTHLESVIRQHADQYLWIHRRWKTRPPGEPPIYE